MPVKMSVTPLGVADVGFDEPVAADAADVHVLERDGTWEQAAGAAHGRGSGRAAEEQRGDEEGDAVHQSRVEEASVQLAAALEQHAEHVEGEEVRAQILEVHPFLSLLAAED